MQKQTKTEESKAFDLVDDQMEIDDEEKASLLKMETVKQKASDNQAIEFDKIKLEDLAIKD